MGADVTQDLYDALSGASAPNTATTHFFTPLSSGAADDNTTIESFDAFPQGGSTLTPGCITTKTGGPSFDRPNSTTNGIAALNDEISGTGWEDTTNTSCTNAPVNVVGQFSFARAARGKKTSGNVLTFVPYARDAVAYLYYDNGTGDLASLTTAQLADFYSGTLTSIDGHTVKPCLTITGSSPRSNLETAIGVSDAMAEPIAEAAGCDQIQQNSGNAFESYLTSGLPSGDFAILPISAGDWIGQANGYDVDESASPGPPASPSDPSPTAPPSSASPSPERPRTWFPTPPTTSTPRTATTSTRCCPTNVLSGAFEDNNLVSLFVGNGSALCAAGAADRNPRLRLRQPHLRLKAPAGPPP